MSDQPTHLDDLVHALRQNPILAQIVRALMLQVAEHLDENELEELFTSQDDSRVHSILKNHNDKKHTALKGRKSQPAAAPASEPSFEQMPSGRRALIGRNATAETNNLFRSARKGGR